MKTKFAIVKELTSIILIVRPSLYIIAFLFSIPQLFGQASIILDDHTQDPYRIQDDSVMIINRSGETNWVFASGPYDLIHINLQDGSGRTDTSWTMGWALPASDPEFLHAIQSSPTTIINLVSDTVFIHIDRILRSENNLTSVNTPLLLSKARFNQQNRSSIFLIAFIAGILLALAGYNLLLYFSVRDSAYLYFVAREIIFLLLWINLYKYFYTEVWPQSPFWNKYSFWLNISVYGILNLLFTSKYLEIPRVRPVVQKIFYAIMAGYLVTSIIGIYELTIFIYYNFLIPFIFLVVIIGVIRDPKLKNFRPRTHYTLAFGFFLIGVFISILSRFYIFPINFFTQHAVLAGVILEALLFSIGLADRINHFKEQAERNRRQLDIEQAESRVIKNNLEEKELLLKEIHHRVKNNLQLIYSLLNLQKQHIREPHSLLALENSQLRIRSMSLVHQRLYESENLKEIDMASYLSDLIQNIIDTVLVRNEKKNIKVQIQSHPISLDTAIPLGLIINELINNACKYAIKHNPGSGLTVRCNAENGIFRLMIRDFGPGIQGFDGSQPDFTSLGLRLVFDLVKQLHGRIGYVYNEGSIFEMEIPNRKNGSSQNSGG